MKKFYLCYRSYNHSHDQNHNKTIRKQIKRIAAEYGFEVIDFKWSGYYNHPEFPDAFIDDIFPVRGIYLDEMVHSFFQKVKRNET